MSADHIQSGQHSVDSKETHTHTHTHVPAGDISDLRDLRTVDLALKVSITPPPSGG